MTSAPLPLADNSDRASSLKVRIITPMWTDPATWRSVQQKSPDVWTCYYCGLTDRTVECAGIYYCPNVLCDGPGGAYHRQPFTDADDRTDVLAWLDAHRGPLDNPTWEEARMYSARKIIARFAVLADDVLNDAGEGER